MAESRFDGFMKAAGPLPIFALVAALSGGLVFAARGHADRPSSIAATVGDLKPVHAGVSVQGSRVGSLRRLALGDRVVTDAEGRARLRLDDGTGAIVDRDTRVLLGVRGLALETGRLHVTSPLGAHSEVTLGALTVLMSGATAGLAHRGGKLSVYAVDGELTVRALGQESRVRAGETARIAGGKLEVVPERAYDDWTGGLARAWAARGTPRRAIGELWGLPNEDTAGSPLTIRSHRVNASIDRELSHTTSETTFFNGGSAAVQGDFRVALPPGALVSSFAVTRAGAWQTGRPALASRTETRPNQEDGVLEWAGEGWLRGSLSNVKPGQELTVSVTYTEWLSPRQSGDRAFVQYRYPLVGSDEAPLIGEFSARVDASPSGALELFAGYGARSDGRAAVIARSDFRPSADFVVGVEMRKLSEQARLYMAPPDDAGAGSAVLLRTELPTAEPADGVTLAIVLDSSGSIDPALLEAERALTRALLEGLGSRDRVVVLGADQSTRALGPAELGPVDAARRKAITRALDGLAPGGASDLGRALETAADALPADAPAAMVVYVGDGWPTLGDGRPEAILARLARRPNGAPRLGAIALGPLANRRVLSALTQGTGPLFEVADSPDAARVAIELISDALRPTLAGVEVDLGPEVDQVYPRGPRAIAAGETVMTVGRVRGAPPASVKIRFRDARGVHEEVRRVELFRSADPAEVQRRWAAQRVEEIVLRGKGREAATDVALRAGLITPWTALKLGDGPAAYVPSHLESRVLDLSSDGDSVLGPVLATPAELAGSITVVDDHSGGAADLAEGLQMAVGRILNGAAPSVRACRDSRVSMRPELAGALEIALTVDGDGLPHDVRVRGATPAAEDAALNRCVTQVIEALRFPATSVAQRVRVERLIQLPPPPPSLGARRCSNVSKLAMPLRRGAWWSRLTARPREASAVYLESKRQCELATWTDRRALLELLLLATPNGTARVQLAEELERAGETDAAALIRREAVRRVQSPEELAAVRNLLLGSERYPATVFEDRYRTAAGDAQRLEVVARFLQLAPHDSRLRRRQVALLDALGKKPEVAELARVLRTDPFADAELLCDVASALRRAGFDAEARRTFGELAERAPRDPWARALLGDRLRAEGWFDDATAAYTVLEDLVPEDARAVLRAALAHAGAGRVDIAERLLTRVAQTGGRAGDAGLGDLARQLGRSLAGEALAQKAPLDSGEARELRRVARELSQAETSHVLLLRAEGARADLTIALESGAGVTKETRSPDISASSLGLYLFRVSGDAALAGHKLSASRPATLAPATPIILRVDTLLAAAPTETPYRSERRELPHDGKPVEFSTSP